MKNLHLKNLNNTYIIDIYLNKIEKNIIIIMILKN